MPEIEAAAAERPEELWNEQLAGDLTVDEWCDYWLSENRHWAGDGFNVGDALVDLQASAAMIRKMKAALVRPDDATPYSGDAWLESPGLAIGITKDSRGRWWAEAHQDGQRIVLCEIKTKGDLRSLLKILGIACQK